MASTLLADGFEDEYFDRRLAEVEKAIGAHWADSPQVRRQLMGEIGVLGLMGQRIHDRDTDRGDRS